MTRVRAFGYALVLGVTLGIAVYDCAPKTLSPQAQIIYTTDQVVIRLGEVQNAVIAACAAGAGTTCTGTAISTDTARALVQAITSTMATLKQVPNGWQVIVATAWMQAKLQPALLTPQAQGYVQAINALLGVQ